MDHVVAEKHDGETTEANLALCCVLCNQFKGSDLSSIDPETQGLTALFNPRLHHWDDHFFLDGVFIKSKSAAGRVTVKLLRFNEPDRVTEQEWMLAAKVWS